MGEFIGRWMVVGGVCAACLAAAGGRTGNGWGWFLVAVWFGFCNAALRPLALRTALRLRLTGWRILLLLMGLLALVNAGLFISPAFWVPSVSNGSADPTSLLLAAAVASLCSWGASARFRTHDGNWHWITHHGSVLR